MQIFRTQNLLLCKFCIPKIWYVYQEPGPGNTLDRVMGRVGFPTRHFGIPDFPTRRNFYPEKTPDSRLLIRVGNPTLVMGY